MTKDLLTTARERELGAYLVALESAGLDAELQAKGPFTVFIPIDAAFERFSTSELDALDADFDALRRLMQYTIVRGALASDSLARLDSVETLGGEALEITVVRGLEVNGIKIVEADVECSNGVAHILAEAPIPPSLRGLVRAEMLGPPAREKIATSEDASNSASNAPAAAQTAETIENAARNYAADAETARPINLEKDYQAFAADIAQTEKDAEAFAEDLRVAAAKAEAFERKIDDEEDDEDAGAFERGYERAEKVKILENDDFYADVDSHFAENARRGEEDCVCVGEEETPSV